MSTSAAITITVVAASSAPVKRPLRYRGLPTGVEKTISVIPCSTSRSAAFAQKIVSTNTPASDSSPSDCMTTYGELTLTPSGP